MAGIASEPANFVSVAVPQLDSTLPLTTLCIQKQRMSSRGQELGWSDLMSTVHVTTALLYLLLVLVIFTVTKRWFFIDGRLPGPPPIPIIGSLYVIFFNPSNFIAVLTKLAQFYGNVYSFRMGSVPAIVVCGHHCVNEVLVTNAKTYVDRPLLGYMKNHPECLGIFFQNGEKWTTLRKMALRTIHDLDRAKPNNIRRYIHGEMEELVDYVKAKNGVPFDPSQILALTVTNTMSSIMLNTRYDYSDKRLKRLIDVVDRMFTIEGYGQMEHFIPALRFLKHIGIGNNYENEIVQLRQEIKDFILSEDNSPFLMSAGDQEIKSLAHAFRNRVDDDAVTLHQSAASALSITDWVVNVCILDMIQAGMAATKGTAEWLILYLAVFPEIAERCQKEISQVYGDKPIATDTREEQVPYVTATIYEVMRISTTIPTTAPHMVTEDTTLNGYPVEKGTLVLVNLHSVHHEKDYWGDPSVFRPSRFLDSEGSINRMERHISFGAGPRECLGQQIAMKTIFDFFVTMLTNFDITIPKGCAPPSLKGVTKIAYQPKPYKIVATPR